MTRTIPNEELYGGHAAVQRDRMSNLEIMAEVVVSRKKRLERIKARSKGQYSEDLRVNGRRYVRGELGYHYNVNLLEALLTVGPGEWRETVEKFMDDFQYFAITAIAAAGNVDNPFDGAIKVMQAEWYAENLDFINEYYRGSPKRYPRSSTNARVEQDGLLLDFVLNSILMF